MMKGRASKGNEGELQFSRSIVRESKRENSRVSCRKRVEGSKCFGLLPPCNSLNSEITYRCDSKGSDEFQDRSCHDKEYFKREELSALIEVPSSRMSPFTRPQEHLEEISDNLWSGGNGELGLLRDEELCLNEQSVASDNCQVGLGYLEGHRSLMQHKGPNDNPSRGCQTDTGANCDTCTIEITAKPIQGNCKDGGIQSSSSLKRERVINSHDCSNTDPTSLKRDRLAKRSSTDMDIREKHSDVLEEPESSQTRESTVERSHEDMDVKEKHSDVLEEPESSQTRESTLEKSHEDMDVKEKHSDVLEEPESSQTRESTVEKSHEDMAVKEKHSDVLEEPESSQTRESTVEKSHEDMDIKEKHSGVLEEPESSQTRGSTVERSHEDMDVKEKHSDVLEEPESSQTRESTLEKSHEDMDVKEKHSDVLEEPESSQTRESTVEKSHEDMDVKEKHSDVLEEPESSQTRESTLEKSHEDVDIKERHSEVRGEQDNPETTRKNEGRKESTSKLRGTVIQTN